MPVFFCRRVVWGHRMRRQWHLLKIKTCHIDLLAVFASSVNFDFNSLIKVLPCWCSSILSFILAWSLSSKCLYFVQKSHWSFFGLWNKIKFTVKNVIIGPLFCNRFFAQRTLLSCVYRDTFLLEWALEPSMLLANYFHYWKFVDMIRNVISFNSHNSFLVFGRDLFSVCKWPFTNNLLNVVSICSPMARVFWCRRSWQNSNGVTLTDAPNAGGVG